MESTISSNLVPKHSIASDAEVAGVLGKLKKRVSDLPIIFSSDPALHELDVKQSDVIRIDRKSAVTGKIEPYYRAVVED